MSKRQTELSIRAAATEKLQTRTTLPFIPSTLNAENRSVEFILVTEAPVRIFDVERMEVVDEILLMSGMVLPKNNQVVMLDNHNRDSNGDVLGSWRQFRIEGDQVISRCFFGKKQLAFDTWIDVQDGHITDASAGYRRLKSIWIPEGTSQVFDGRERVGPVMVVTQWMLKEGSITPIGADDRAKARSEEPVHEVHVLTPEESAAIEAAARNQEISASSAEKNTRGGSFNMNPKLLKLLILRGLAKEATNEQALAYLAAMPALERAAVEAEANQPDVPLNPQVDPRKLEDEITTRATTILTLCQEADLPDMATDLIRSKKTLDQARAEILTKVIEGRRKDGRGSDAMGRIVITADETDKFRAAAVDGLLVRGGVLDVKRDKPAAGFGDYSNMGFSDLARECLTRAGYQVRNLTKDELYRMAIQPTINTRGGGPALTTSDFPNILGAANTKSLMLGWNYAKVTYDRWCRIGNLANFQAHQRVKLSDAPDLQTILDGQEVKQAAFSDQGETIQLGCRGIIVGIGRQALINDDLSAFKTVPMALTARARQNVNHAVYALIQANAAMADGITLFHATSHGANLASGGDIGDPDPLTTMAVMEKVMMEQTGPKGTKLNYRPRFIMCGSYHKNSVGIIVGSPTLSVAGMPTGTKNPWNGLEPIYDSEITARHWFGAEDPLTCDTVEVAFLNGRDGPTVELLDANPFYLGVYNRIYLDYAVADIDYRGLYFNPGA